MPKCGSARRRKRSFQGNQHTERNKMRIADEEGQPRVAILETREGVAPTSVSSKKIGTVDVEKDQINNTKVTITGYRFVDMELLAKVFSLLRCADCGNFNLAFMENNNARKGCASSLKILCENCGWKHGFCSSKKQKQSYEVNRRLVYSMRLIGKGHSGAKKFCSTMNMPPPPWKSAYRKSSKIICNKIKKIAKKSMSQACKDIRSSSGARDDEVVNCGVSCDGTWQKRGFSSLNGCVAVLSIDSGKVLDAEALSKGCKQCELHTH